MLQPYEMTEKRVAYGFMWAISLGLQVLNEKPLRLGSTSKQYTFIIIYITRVYIYISFTHRHTHTHIYIYIHNGHVAKSDIDASNELIGNFGDIFYVHPPILQSMITQIDRFCGCKKGWIWMDGWMDKLVDRFV